MTKIIIIAILSIYISLGLNGSSNLESNYQTTQDTTKYLKDNFVNNKAKFQHKQLKHLLAKLKLSVKSYTPIRGKKLGEIKGISIYFENKASINSKWEKQIRVKTMYIAFETPVSIYTDVTDLYNESNGQWLPAEAAFYGKQIVKDIVSAK